MWLGSALSGCISDDTSECVGQAYLRFSYTHNEPQDDLLTAQVEYINLFFYDGQEQLADSRCIQVTDLDENGGILLEIPEGTYTVVAWGNNHDDKFEVTGSSAMKDLRLSLLEGQDGYASSVPHLFYGRSTVTASAMNIAEGHISLIKNTNHIRVVIVDVSGTRAGSERTLPDTDLKVRIMGCNWRYDYANNLCEQARERIMEYGATNGIDGEGRPQAEFDILRMFADNACQLELVLEDVRHPEEEPLKRFGLTQKVIETIPHVNTTDDLDRYDDYEVRIEVELRQLTWTVVRILINDWEMKEFEGGI